MKDTLLLGRTFFRRFFETDLMPPGLAQVQLVIGAMTFLAAPSFLMPFNFATRYAQMGKNVEAIARAMVLHRLLFITFTMTALGLVALVVWEGVFPDRRDARILGSLPLRSRTLIAARLGALGALAGLFIVGTNAVPTLVYGPVLSGFGGALTPIHGMAAHFLATTAAGAFVFFGLIALQGLLLNVTGRRMAERLSVVLQVVFVVALLQMIFFFPRVLPLVGRDLSALTAHPIMGYVPSVWFLALYDVLCGRPSPASGGPAALAAALTITVTIAACVLFLTTHGRLMKRALETRDTARHTNRFITAASWWLNTRLIRNSTKRAVLHFTLKTMTRSRTHRMLVALHAGIALALVLSGFIPLVMRSGLAGLTAPTVPLLSAPFVLIFLCLAGMRAAFAIPVEPKANWMVRLLEPPDRSAALNGAAASMLLAVVMPVTVLAAIWSLFLFDPWQAFVHATFCVLLGWLLAELLVLTLFKIPFTCTYYPGLSKMRTFWPLYLTAFTNFCYTTPLVEQQAFSNGAVFAWTAGVGLLAIASTRFARSRLVRALPGLRFEEQDPEVMFQGFKLSEGLAATAGTRAN
jgi:hypothetical protein